MKLFYLIPSFMFAISVHAQVIPSDSLALVDFYNGLDGPNWSNQENWLNGPVGTWEGIMVENNRVTNINLPNNDLQGDLPDAFYQLTGLKSFNLLNNDITGELKDDIINLIEVTGLGFQGCKLSGTFPQAVGQMQQLTSLAFASNNFSGPLPESIGNLDNLTTIFFHGNNFEGPVPESWKGMPNLSTINLQSNNLTGSIDVFGHLPRLRNLRLSENNWDPQPFPAYLDTMPELFLFECHNCNLTGDLPVMNFSDQADVSSISVANNHLSGNIVYLLRNNPSFSKYYLDISENNFSGVFRLPGVYQVSRVNINDNHFDEIGTIEFDDLDQILMRNNAFDFGDLLSISDLINEDSIDISYTPQDSIGMAETRMVQEGATVTLHAGTDTPGNGYTWFFGGVNLGTFDTPELMIVDAGFFDSGFYRCEVHNPGIPFLTLHSRPVELIIEKGTGVAGIPGIQALHIYPNPAIDYVDVSAPALKNDGNWTLFDSRGILVRSGKAATDDQSFRIDLAGLSAGVHQVVLEGDTGVFVGRFIVQGLSE